MKRYYIIGVIVVLFTLFVFSGCTKIFSNCKKDDSDKNHSIYSDDVKDEKDMVPATIYINGNILQGSTAYLDPESEEIRLPFLKIVQSLGMGTEEKNDGIVYITYNEEVYVLECYPNVILYPKKEVENNLMIPVPGASFYYRRYKDGDVLLDSETLAGVLSLMDVNFHFHINEVDYINSTINITTSLKNNY
jgi:hypothetical protein